MAKNMGSDWKEKTQDVKTLPNAQLQRRGRSGFAPDSLFVGRSNQKSRPTTNTTARKIEGCQRKSIGPKGRQSSVGSRQHALINLNHARIV